MMLVGRREMARRVHFEELLVPFQRRFDRVHVLRVERVEQRILNRTRSLVSLALHDILPDSRPSTVRNFRICRSE